MRSPSWRPKSPALLRGCCIVATARQLGTLMPDAMFSSLVALLLLLGRTPRSLRVADPLPEDTRQQLRDAQAALQTLLDYIGQGGSVGRAECDQNCAADTCIEALIAAIAVLGDVSFGDIRSISFVGEGRGLCDPGMFDSPACSEHSSRRSSRSSRHISSEDAEMGSASLGCSYEPPCEPAWSDTPPGSHGYACEVQYAWDRDQRSITPAQREHCTAV